MLYPYNPRILTEEMNSTIHQHRLWRLPNLSGLPTIKDSINPSTIVLIPLFKVRDDIFKMYTQTAIWAWYTLYHNTDANEHNIPIYFYVEDQLVDYVRPIFEENGIDWETHVKIMETTEYQGYCAKKMIFYYDEQFKDYEYIYLIDADTFIGSPDSLHKFEFFDKHEPILDGIGFGNVRIIPSGYSPIDLMRERLGSLGGDLTKPFSLHDAFLKIGIANPDEAIKKICGNKIQDCSAWLIRYPARHFHENHQDVIEFFRRTSKVLSCDETMARIILTLHDLEMYQLMTDEMLICLHHANPEREVFVLARDIDKQPYMLHGSGDVTWEFIWVEHMKGTEHMLKSNREHDEKLDNEIQFRMEETS